MSSIIPPQEPGNTPDGNTPDPAGDDNHKTSNSGISGMCSPANPAGRPGRLYSFIDRSVDAHQVKRTKSDIKDEHGEYLPSFLETSAGYRVKVLENLRKWFDGRDFEKNLSNSIDKLSNKFVDQKAVVEDTQQLIMRQRRSMSDRVTFFTEADRYNEALMEVQFNWDHLRNTKDVIHMDGMTWHDMGTVRSSKISCAPIIHEHLLSRGFVFGLQPDAEMFYGKFDHQNRLTAYYYLKRRAVGLIDIRSAVDERDEIWKILEIAVNHSEYHIDRRANVLTATGYRMGGGFVTEESVIDSSADLALPCFYPWFKDDIKTYFSEYMSSKAAVLLLLGDPGTGKSTFLRTALSTNQLRALIVTKAEVFSNSAFIPTCREMIKSGKIDLIVMEDADIFVRPRTENNYQMQELLDITNGIDASLKVKFVFTTNLKKIDMVDAALLRPGRAFDYLVFQKMTRTQVGVVRTKLGLPPAVFPENLPKNRKFTLADAAAATEISKDDDGIIKPRF